MLHSTIVRIELRRSLDIWASKPKLNPALEINLQTFV